MIKTFVTADIHFGHRNIIKHCNRPFSDVDEMNKTITHNWNSVVGKNDIVYVLGDFCFRGNTFWTYIKALNGNIKFILGNHDKEIKNFFKKYNTTLIYRKDIDEYYGGNKTYELLGHYWEGNINGQFIVMCHYPMLSWNHSNHGSWQLFGHCHGKLNQTTSKLKSLDVGVDCWNYFPVSFDQISECMKNKEKLNNESQ